MLILLVLFIANIFARFILMTNLELARDTRVGIPWFRIKPTQVISNLRFLDILTGSALSAFGSISLDCSFDQSGDFMSPPIEETNQIKSPVQQPAAQPKAWATVARK